MKLKKLFERLNISASHFSMLVNILISITFLSVFLTQPKHMGHLRYYINRNVLNNLMMKYDDDFHWIGLKL